MTLSNAPPVFNNQVSESWFAPITHQDQGMGRPLKTQPIKSCTIRFNPIFLENGTYCMFLTKYCYVRLMRFGFASIVLQRFDR